MSSLRQRNGDDYPDAAHKHLADAKVLMAGGRHDGAAYLAGYVVECALKSLILVEGTRPEPSHDLESLSGKLRTMATQVGFRTIRVYVSAQEILDGAEILAWKPGMRYQDARVTRDAAKSWLQEAKDIYSRIIDRLRYDGVIS